jgi:hypothetical protein
LPVAVHPSEGRFTIPSAAVQPWRLELVFMPLTCHSQYPSGSAQSGGEPSLVKAYLNDPRWLEAAVPRLNLAAREMVIKPLRFLAQPREAHCGS